MVRWIDGELLKTLWGLRTRELVDLIVEDRLTPCVDGIPIDWRRQSEPQISFEDVMDFEYLLEQVFELERKGDLPISNAEEVQVWRKQHSAKSQAELLPRDPSDLAQLKQKATDDRESVEELLDGKDKRTFGLMKRKIDTIPEIIRASVEAALFAQEYKEQYDQKITRAKLEEKIYQDPITKAIFNEIHKALTEKKLTHRPGAPKKL